MITHANFCVLCGNKLKLGVPPEDDVERLICIWCHHVHYENPQVWVTSILYRDTRLLWIKSAQAPVTGGWTIPGGFVERGESVTAAASRRVLTGAQLHVEERSFCIYGVLSIPHTNEVHVFLLAPIPNADFPPAGKAADVRLMTEHEIGAEVLAFSPASSILLADLYCRLRAGDLAPVPAKLLQP
jgi:ADP-ribose pyrophosphatase YjhB (NUDIX family)